MFYSVLLLLIGYCHATYHHVTIHTINGETKHIWVCPTSRHPCDELDFLASYILQKPRATYELLVGTEKLSPTNINRVLNQEVLLTAYVRPFLAIRDRVFIQSYFGDVSLSDLRHIEDLNWSEERPVVMKEIIDALRDQETWDNLLDDDTNKLTIQIESDQGVFSFCVENPDNSRQDVTVIGRHKGRRVGALHIGIGESKTFLVNAESESVSVLGRETWAPVWKIEVIASCFDSVSVKYI